MSDENAFLAAYTRANEALEKGDTATARKFFLVAARLADEQAATGARELSEKRRERAKRLYDIADSLAPAKKQANKSAGKTPPSPIVTGLLHKFKGVGGCCRPQDSYEEV